MAPIKFEENIKDKLEQRVLNPSPQAWQKLSERLDAEPKKKTNKTYWWLGIAASFVGLLIVSSIVFKGSDEGVNTPVLVEQETEAPIQMEDNATDDIAEKQKTEETQVVFENSKKEIKNVEKTILKTNKLVVNNKPEEMISIHESPVEENIVERVTYKETNSIAKVESLKTPEEKKIDEVVNLIQELQKEKIAVTDAEIDALLSQAQEELMTERLYNESTKTVDAELLLLQVETDLDQSFRDKVFEALKSGYKKVKTAVAERNN